MFVRAAMAAVERERLLVVLHGGPYLPQPVICIPMKFGCRVARIAQDRKLERGDRVFPIGLRKRLFAGCEIQDRGPRLS